MRDLALFAALAIVLPLTLRRPWIGVIAWAVLSLMNPHRLAWGLARDFPFAQLIALATLFALVVTQSSRVMKGGWAAAVLLAFVGWMTLTTVLVAMQPAEAWAMWIRVLKIQLMTFVALLLLHKREHVQALIWAVVLSIGFFGVKGGIFTIVNRGENRVWGPAESFIADNNALGLAIVMTIPFFLHLYRTTEQVWIRRGLIAGALLSAVAVLGTHSRGALLAIMGMGALYWWRSDRKVAVGAAFFLVALAAIPLMPDKWFDRMETITNYKEDASAMGRINAWTVATRIAIDRPLGGGFVYYSPEASALYAPDPTQVRSAHSIYFQVLGEHGFVGLALFLVLWVSVWRIASRIRNGTRGREEYAWAFSLATMTQASLAGYAVGGAFLDLAYFDLPYFLFVALAVTRWILLKDGQFGNVGDRPMRSGSPLVRDPDRPAKATDFPVLRPPNRPDAIR